MGNQALTLNDKVMRAATTIMKGTFAISVGIQNVLIGTSLVNQWLRLHTPNARDPGSIPGWETRSHIPQLKVLMPQIKKKMPMPQLRPDTAK